MNDRRPVPIVCSILPHPPSSGGQRRALRLAEAVERAGGRPHLLTTDGGDERAADVLRDRGWTVELQRTPRASIGNRLRMHAGDLIGPRIPAIRSRLAELESEGTTFVQVEQILNGRAATPTGLPIVLSTHNVEAELVASIAAQAPHLRDRARLRLRGLQTARAERRMASLSEAVLCVSDHDAAYFEGLGARRVLVVPNGVDDDLFEVGPPPGRGSAILFFGLLSYAPNDDGVRRFLREGWSALVARHPEAQLRIVGAGASAELIHEAAELSGVELAGRVDSIQEELARAEFVLAPLWSGGGTRLKALESMAAARAVVGTPLGVERIGFSDGVHGLLGESPAELAEAAATLLDDPDRARAMGDAGRSFAGGHRWADLTRPAEALYAELLGRAGGRVAG